MNAYEQYAKAAHSRVNQPARLVGVMRTRAEARTRYAEIVAEMAECADADQLEGYLSSIQPELLQFQAELEFLWTGEDDFAGLETEIQRARARCDGPATSRYFEEETEE